MTTEPLPSREPGPALTLEDALERLGGDRDLLADVASIFLSDAPAMLGDVASAVAAADGPGVARTVHRLKGSLLTFGAPRAVAAALTLEEQARAGDLSTALASLQRLGTEIDRLREVLNALVQGETNRSA